MDAERIAEIQTLLHQSRDVQGYWPETLRATVSSLLSEIDSQDLRLQQMDGLIHRGHVAMQAATEFQANTEARVEAQRNRADAAEALVATLTQRLTEVLRTHVTNVETLRRENGWPTPYFMRRTADALDQITPAKYGDVLRWVADLADADVISVEQAERTPLEAFAERVAWRQDAEGALREAMTDVLAVAEVPDEEAPVALMESLRNLGFEISRIAEPEAPRVISREEVSAAATEAEQAVYLKDARAYRDANRPMISADDIEWLTTALTHLGLAVEGR